MPSILISLFTSTHHSHVYFVFLALALVTVHSAAAEWLDSSPAPPSPSPPSSDSEVDLIARSLLSQLLGDSYTSLPSPSSMVLDLARIALPATGLMLVIFDLFSQDPFTVGRPCSLIGVAYLIFLPLLVLLEALDESSVDRPSFSLCMILIDRFLMRRALGLFCVTELLLQYGFTLLIETGLLQPMPWQRELLGLVSASDASELFLLVVRPMTLLIILITLKRCDERPYFLVYVYNIISIIR